MKPRSMTKASHKLTSSHQAKKGTMDSTRPPSKPTACAMRRRTLRPLTSWRRSQASKMELKTRFHVTASTEAPTEATSECMGAWPMPASTAAVNVIAIPSYRVTYTTLRFHPCLYLCLSVSRGACAHRRLPPHHPAVKNSIFAFVSAKCRMAAATRLRKNSGRVSPYPYGITLYDLSYPVAESRPRWPPHSPALHYLL